MSEKQLYTADAQAGKILNIAGGRYRVIISGAHTEQAYTLIEMTVPPNAGPLPHTHKHIDETFYVLKGKVHFYSEEGDYVAEEGAYVRIPKGGLIHSFKNETAEAAVLLCTMQPAGTEVMFEEISDYFQANPELSDQARKDFFFRLAKKYDTELFPPDYFWIVGVKTIGLDKFRFEEKAIG